MSVSEAQHLRAELEATTATTLDWNAKEAMRRTLLALIVCLVAGCSLFGSDDGGQCESEREGLSIRTDRESYQVGEEAVLTLENCTGEALYVENDFGSSPPDYHLEKKVAGEWKLADSREGGIGNGYREVEPAEIYEFTTSVSFEEFLEDATPPGTYRYVLFIYKGPRGSTLLPEEKRVSNTFEVTE